MLVDDDLDVLNMYTEVLRKAGHEVDAFSRGIEAANSCVERRYALVICDINMPDVDGVSLLRMVRAQRPHMPFIFLSGHAAYEANWATLDADGLLLKTDGLAKLRDKVKEILLAKGNDAGSSRPARPAVTEALSSRPSAFRKCGR
jgi:DNA-binding response OmpR family regulator